MTDPERIRELLLENLFAVLNVRDPQRRVALVRDGRIALLHTLLTTRS